MLSALAQVENDLYGSLSVPDVSINWWAILVATAAAMAIGSLWYGPLFGQKWMKFVKLTKKDTEANWKTPMTIMVVMAFVQTIILKHFIVYVGYFYPDINQLLLGILTGFWLFAGIALPLILSSNIFARRPVGLSYVEAGNQFITLIVIGAILSTWT
jgi:hypothetical protein